MRAFIYGYEVTILDYYITESGKPFCKAKNSKTGVVLKIPQSWVEIRK